MRVPGSGPRADAALAAFTTPSNGSWIMFGKHPS
jgi:hypothetical protein